MTLTADSSGAKFQHDGQSVSAPPVNITDAEATARSALTNAQRLQRQVAAVKHGQYIRSASGLKLRYRRVRRLAARVYDAMPWLTDADRPTVRAWCELEIIASTAFAELYANDILTGGGEPRRLLSEYRQLRAAQLQYASALGMSPAARMSLNVGAAKALALDRGESISDADVEALEARLVAKISGEQTYTPHDHGALRHEHHHREGDGHDHRPADTRDGDTHEVVPA